MDRLPDDNMAKRVITAIINTPRPDFTQLNKDVDEYIATRLAEMSEEERKRRQAAGVAVGQKPSASVRR